MNNIINKALIVFILLSSLTKIYSSNISDPNQHSSYNNTDSSSFCNDNTTCTEDYFCELHSNTCIHKEYFPFSNKQLFSITILCFLSGIATNTGIGGGTVITTILMSIDNFSPKEAAPLSILIIFFCSLSTFLMGVKAKNDDDHFKFVDYDIVLICCPLVLFGSKVGTILHIILPNSLILLILLVVLIVSTIKTYKNAYFYKKKEEKEEKESLLIEETQLSFEILNRISNKNLFSNKSNKEVQSKGDDFNLKDVLERKISIIKEIKSNRGSINEIQDKILGNSMEIMEEFDENHIKQEETIINELIKKVKEIELLKSNLFDENKAIRGSIIKTMLELVVFLILVELAIGNNNRKSLFDISQCSYEYYLIILIFGGICLLISFICYKNMKKEEEISNLFSNLLLKKEEREAYYLINYLENSSITKLRFVSFLSGLISSVCGVGGGIILAPALIEIGIHPKISASSSNLLVIISSFSSSILFLMMNKIYLDYSIIYCSLCSLSSIIGNYIINKYTMRTKKISFLIFYLLYIMIFSIILLPINGIIRVIDEYNKTRSIFWFSFAC